MAWKRVAPFVIVGACVLFAIYTAVHPSRAVGSCPCNLPQWEYTSADGHDTTDGPHALSLTAFDQTIGDDLADNWAGDGLLEFSSQSGDDVCWDRYPNSVWNPDGNGWTLVTGGSWTVSSANGWSPDNLGYGELPTSDYHSWLGPSGELPCGTTIYQRMEIYCPIDHIWYYYIDYSPEAVQRYNLLTATIASNYNENCRSEFTGDSSACEDEPYPQDTQ